MIGTAERGPDPETSRPADPVTPYLRTFEHLAPTEQPQARSRPQRQRTWIALPLLGLLALTLVGRPGQESPSPEPAGRATAPQIALAPSAPPAAGEGPPARVVERQGPKLIEKLLAEKLGTPVPTRPRAEKQQVAPPEPQLPPEPSAPNRVDEPVPEKPVVVAAAAPPPATPERVTAPELVGPKPQVAPPKPAPAAQKPASPAAKPAPAAPKPVVATPKPVRVEERPVVVARAEPRPVEQKPVTVVVRPVPVPPAAPPVVVASVPRAEPPPIEAERVAVARAPLPRPPAGPSPDAVRGLLDRYAAAWRGHDIDTLRAIGQVTSDGQANALRQYFANVVDLEVEVRVLDIRNDGDRAMVRFTRRDRFRDPMGREIAKESPPIEKTVVTTPQGLRFAPSS